MANIHITRNHHLGLAQARKLAFRWAEVAEEKLDMECTYEEGKTADVVHFKRPGASGELHVTKDHFNLDAKLGLLLGVFKDRIETEIVKNLDVLLADRPAPASPNLRLYSHALGRSAIGWYAPPVLAAAARAGFPRSLAELPVLLPTGHAAVRAPLDQWFERLGVQPRIVGEFEDSALLKTFGAAGMGLFPAAEWVHEHLLTHYAVQRLGACDGVLEHFYAIGTEPKVRHPLVQRLLQATTS